jgi:hypothetical protein
MSQPVKVADSLLEAARAAAEDAHRSMAGQIEHWAVLGQAVDHLLTTQDVVTLKRSAGRLEGSRRQALIDALANALDPERRELARAIIGGRDLVRYESDPTLPELIIQVLPDGTRRRTTRQSSVRAPG